MKVKAAESCLTLCDPMDCSLPGSSVRGILQVKILEWVAIPFSKGSSQPRDQTQLSHIAGGFLYQLSHQGSPRILEWVAYPFSSGSSQPRNWTRVSSTAGRFSTSWAARNVTRLPSKGTLIHQHGPRAVTSSWVSIPGILTPLEWIWTVTGPKSHSAKEVHSHPTQNQSSSW